MTDKYPGRYAGLVKSTLSMCDSFEDVKSCGILFHGTCEPLEGELYGGVDGVFWTADQPSVAQAYIPKSGITSLLTEPSLYNRDEQVSPVQHQSFIMDWALERAGVELEDLDATWDGNMGRVSSWSVPDGWPTCGDLDDHIKSMGYHANEHGIYDLSVPYDEEGREQLMHADWSLPGQLIIVLPGTGFTANHPDWSEDALNYEPHNRLADFAAFAEAGLHGFRISDRLQSNFLGNVEHEAIGILPAGLERMAWMAIPAIRHDGDSHEVFRNPETAEFIELMKELNHNYRSEHDVVTDSPGFG